MFKYLNPGFPLKNTFQITLYAFQKLYIIADQQHILIRNSIVLPLTSLEIQVSHKLCIHPKSLIIASKHTFQLRDAYSSP